MLVNTNGTRPVIIISPSLCLLNTVSADFHCVFVHMFTAAEGYFTYALL